MAAITASEIDTAIQAIASKGQSFSLNGLTYTRANLGDLLRLRDQLKAEESRSGGTRPLFRGFSFTGMTSDSGSNTADIVRTVTP